MKANQKFANADEAVSPVIGVILMVAITVVLAAVVFVLVSDLGGDSKNAPSTSWSVNEADDRVVLTKGPVDLEWDDFQIRLATTLTDHIVCYAMNDEPLFNDVGVVGPPATADTCDAEDTAALQAGLLATSAQNVDFDSDTSGTNEPLTGAALSIEAGDYLEFCVIESSAPPGTSAAQSSVVVSMTHIASNQVVFEKTFSSVAVCTAAP